MIETERLRLRAWTDDDVAPLLAICRDPLVMEHLGPLQDEAEVRAAIARQQGLLAASGHCYWAVERKADGRMIGFCGLILEPPGMPISGEIDIGWRLASDCWGQGYAREAAEASLAWGWAHLPCARIWAITTPANMRSWGLMERIGMRPRPEYNFDHPNVPEGSPLRPHVTYSIERPAFTRR